ncbi:MAG: hypothetical protein K0S28_1019 [Paucimonas sp.]|jgi:hypothetical protein|nr:hypothetical protein [Paucimonas sp.]
MKVLAAVLAALVSTAAFAQEAPPPAPVKIAPKESPLIGKWNTTYTQEACVESNEYTEKGLKITYSGEAVTEDFYTLFKLGDGLYKLSGYVGKDNGKPDCAGQLVPVGSTSTIFIKFNPDGSYRSCSTLDDASCYAQASRIAPQPK